jgi:DNA (cytosine-5)-methyltransferase 1
MLDGCQTDSSAEVDWFGCAEIVTAGFPCQDLSFAGQGAGLSGERSGLWWQVRRTLRMVRPRYAVLENVAALLHRGMGTVLGSLAQIGYDAEWNCLQAARFGAPHERDRVWIIATDADKDRKYACAVNAEMAAAQAFGDTDKARCTNTERRDGPPEPFGRSILTPNDVERRVLGWTTEPPLVRVVHGLPGDVDEADPPAVACLGNTVVPQIPEIIGRAILQAEQAQ